MKLVPIKCPSCGAKLEVNEKLKTMTCNYCGENIYVDDEIKKIEVSGTVELSNKKQLEKIVNNAQNYYDIGECSSGNKEIEKVLEQDSFHKEALYTYLKYNINNYYDNKVTIDDYMERLIHADKEDNEYQDKINELNQIKDKQINDEMVKKFIMFGILGVMTIIFGILLGNILIGFIVALTIWGPALYAFKAFKKSF